MSSLDDIMAILRSQQANVQSKQGALQRASAPQQTALRNEGQSGMDVLRRGEPDQRRALMEIGLGLMGHQTGASPGQTIGSSVSRGFDILDEIRGRQRKQGMESAAVGLGGAKDSRKFSQDLADPLIRRENARSASDYQTENAIRLHDYKRQNPENSSTALDAQWSTYANLKKTDPNAAMEYGAAAGFIEPDGSESPLSVFLQKRLSASTDAAMEAGTNYELLTSLASDFENLEDIGSGFRQSTWREKYKEITGTEDADSLLRRRWAGIKNSMAIQNLPPGVASDRDIALAMEGFPATSANQSTVASFLRGLAKLEKYEEEFNSFKANYVSENRTERGMLGAWKEQVSKTGASPSPDSERPVSDYKSTASYNSVEEAEAANLPVGTVVTINGRKARIE